MKGGKKNAFRKRKGATPSASLLLPKFIRLGEAMAADFKADFASALNADGTADVEIRIGPLDPDPRIGVAILSEYLEEKAPFLRRAGFWWIVILSSFGVNPNNVPPKRTKKGAKKRQGVFRTETPKTQREHLLRFGGTYMIANAPSHTRNYAGALVRQVGVIERATRGEGKDRYFLGSILRFVYWPLKGMPVGRN